MRHLNGEAIDQRKCLLRQLPAQRHASFRRGRRIVDANQPRHEGALRQRVELGARARKTGYLLGYRKGRLNGRPDRPADALHLIDVLAPFYPAIRAVIRD
jgi:hypothetical protein